MGQVGVLERHRGQRTVARRGVLRVPVGGVLAGPVLGRPVLSGPVVAGPIVAGPVVSRPVMGRPVMGRPLLTGPVVGTVLSRPPVRTVEGPVRGTAGRPVGGVVAWPAGGCAVVRHVVRPGRRLAGVPVLRRGVPSGPAVAGGRHAAVGSARGNTGCLARQRIPVAEARSLLRGGPLQWTGSLLRTESLLRTGSLMRTGPLGAGLLM
ncbi:hypothetical protein ADL03_18090 [Nocardia sp. NRRL S-836]|nr:hypothetical protein ADL03_18090 [Nocardia sp. NRRL S-836]